MIIDYKSMKTMNLIKGLFILAASGAIVSCGGGKKNVDGAASVKPNVRIEKVYEREVDQLGVFTATVNAYSTNNISPKNGARIERIFAEVGDHVRAGQKLAEMDPAPLIQAKLQMDNDSLEFARTDQLFKVGGTSKSDFDAKKMKYNISKTNYNNLLINTRLISPISGVVTARNYDKGDMFNMGQPLYVVEQIRPVKILVNLSEELYTKVKRGMTVDVKADVYPDEIFKGKVAIVYPSIDPTSRTFTAEVRVDNTSEKIRPGMFCRVTFSFGKANNVVVPDRAIVKQTGSGDRYVYVLNNNKVDFKKVELGRRMDTEYEILSGLKSGEEVIVEGQSKLNNGAEVTVLK